MIVHSASPYSEDMAQKARLVCDTIESHDATHPVPAAELAERFGLEPEEVWGIVEELMKGGQAICFSLEDPACVFSAVRAYWSPASDDELEATLRLLQMAHSIAAEEVVSLGQTAAGLRAEATN